MLLFAVAHADYRFTLVYVGSQGRLSDGTFFKGSAIKSAFEDGTLGLPSEASRWPPCLLGDAAFPLNTYLMRPNPGRCLNDVKKMFNCRLSRARCCVENAFGIPVFRWRSFLGTVSGYIALLTDMIKAAVILHSFLMCDGAYCPIGYGNRMCEEVVQEGCWRQAVAQMGNLSQSSSSRSAPAAMAVCDEIADHFMSPARSLPWQLSVVRCS